MSFFGFSHLCVFLRDVGKWQEAERRSDNQKRCSSLAGRVLAARGERGGGSVPEMETFLHETLKSLFKGG